jgi:inhibitor of KinA sporulation pathway (predicted exonuclease)
MNILALDLELNQDPNGSKIIEIGACCGNTDSGEILEKYTAFVNPHETLQEFIIKLTSITQAEVDAAGTIEEAYLGMEAMAKKYDCQHMPLVWGLGDGIALRKELPKTCVWNFGRRELDVKAVFQAYQMAKGEKIHAGLAKAMTKVGMQFSGKKHRAVDDAVNTFLIYCNLIKRFTLT